MHDHLGDTSYLQRKEPIMAKQEFSWTAALAKVKPAPALGRVPVMPAGHRVTLKWRDRTSLPTRKETLPDGGESPELQGVTVRVPDLPDEAVMTREVFTARPTVASAAQAASVPAYAERDYPSTLGKRSRRMTSPWR